MKLGPATPILRIFDEAAARAFYIGWLGFREDFTHRFAPDMPLYLGVLRGGVSLHLTEHHGDTTSGTRLRIAVDDIDAFYADLCSRPYSRQRPDPPPREQPWGERDVTLTDPFGNRLTFVQEEAP